MADPIIAKFRQDVIRVLDSMRASLSTIAEDQAGVLAREEKLNLSSATDHITACLVSFNDRILNERDVEF